MTGADPDVGHGAQPLVPWARAHHQMLEPRGGVWIVRQLEIDAVQEDLVLSVDVTKYANELSAGVGQACSALAATRERGIDEQFRGKAVRAVDHVPRALVAEPDGTRRAIDRSQCIDRLEQFEQTPVQVTAELQRAFDQSMGALRLVRSGHRAGTAGE
ncbi:MAG: hypothetical protein U1E83_00875 [Methylotetracoccus sp.]